MANSGERGQPVQLWQNSSRASVFEPQAGSATMTFWRDAVEHHKVPQIFLCLYMHNGGEGRLR